LLGTAAETDRFQRRPTRDPGPPERSRTARL